MLAAACLFSAVLPVASQIRIMAPQWLVTQFTDTRGRIDGSTATFGAPFYGERILGQLVYGESKGAAHCTEEDYSVPKPEEVPVEGHSYSEVRLINIVIIKRGKCSFVTKVKIAKLKGAHAVIMVDKDDSKLTAKDISKIIVADDGYGELVEVPSVLISLQEGNKLIDAAKRSKVIMELAWDIPTNHVVQMDLWMSSGSQKSSKFISEFAPNRKALNDLVKFVPHFHVFSMQAGEDFNNLCFDAAARYCAEDPDGSGPITGKMVLLEDVRQLCIHELTRVTSSAKDTAIASGQPIQKVYAEKFWEYIGFFDRTCRIDGTQPHDTFGTECSVYAMGQVGIDANKVTQCMLETQGEKLAKQREDTAWSPTALRINGWRYSGSLSADLVTRALCAGFIDSPEACKTLTKPKVFTIYEQAPPAVDGVGISTLIWSLLFVGLIAGGILLLYKKSLTKSIQTALREEVMLEVQAQMDSYKQLPA